MLPTVISVASVNSVSTFNKTSENIHVIVLTYDAPETDHIIRRDKPGHTTEKRECCSRHHDVIRYKKNPGSIATRVIFIRGFITAIYLPEYYSA